MNTGNPFEGRIGHLMSQQRRTPITPAEAALLGVQAVDFSTSIGPEELGWPEGMPNIHLGPIIMSTGVGWPEEIKPHAQEAEPLELEPNMVIDLTDKRAMKELPKQRVTQLFN